MPTHEELSGALKDAVKVDDENNTLPSLEVLYQELYSKWGGVRQFADDMFDLFQEAKPGSQIKARVGETLMDGIKVLADRGMLASAGDVEAFSDDELDEEINGLIEKAAKHLLLSMSDERD